MAFEVGQVGLWTAFTGGVLSFLSPCVLPLVPPYLSYIAGVKLEDLTASGDADAAERARAAQRRVIIAAVLFVLGFSSVFVAMGASATALGQLLRSYIHILSQVAGIIIIIMGLHFLGVFRISFLLMEKRLNVNAKPATAIGAYVMGLAFALGWTPCIGPVLAAILPIAASEESVAKGALLLAVYSAGLGVPFLIAAFAIDGFLDFMKRMRKYMGIVEKVMGAFLIITGLLFLTNNMQLISNWMLEMFPALQNVG